MVAADDKGKAAGTTRYINILFHAQDFCSNCVRRRRTHPNREKLLLLWTIRVVNLAPPENFSGANDVISMPCASVLLFAVISLDKIVLCYGLSSLLFGGFSSKVEEF